MTSSLTNQSTTYNNHPRTTISPSTSFLAYVEADIQHLHLAGQYGVERNRASALRQLRRFLALRGKKDITFRNLQPRFILDFEAWLRKHVSRNTSSCYLRSLQKPYNSAVRQGLTPDQKPFVDAYCGVDRTAKRAIPANDIRRIQELDIPSALKNWSLQHGKRTHGYYYSETLRYLEMSRDLFLFSFCMRGMAFVDIACLQWTNIRNGNVEYTRRKTGQPIVVHIETMGQHIIQRWGCPGRYVFPIIQNPRNDEDEYRQYKNGLTLYNRYLKVLGTLLGGLHLTSYTSRHSWASAAQAEHVPLSVISQGMGHDSERTTRIYLQSLDNRVIDQANNLILTSVFLAPSTPPSL